MVHFRLKTYIRIFLIADRDKGKDKKHQEFIRQSLESHQNFNYHVLNVREIENILSLDQLRKYLPLITKIDHDLLVGTPMRWDQQKTRYLGEYLVDKLGAENLPKGLVAKSGTLKTYYKTKLAEVVSSQVTWGELSDEAKELTKQLYKFIKESNH